MARTNDRETVLSTSYTTTDPLTSSTFEIDERHSKIVYTVWSTVAGTIQIRYHEIGSGTARNRTAALAVAASDLTILTFEDPMPKSSAVFTPGSATSGSVVVEAYGAA